MFANSWIIPGDLDPGCTQNCNAPPDECNGDKDDAESKCDLLFDNPGRFEVREPFFFF